MINYSFILLNGEQEHFLNKLRELGVMDITRSAKPVDKESADMLEEVKDCKSAISELKRTDFSKDPDIESINKAAAQMTLPKEQSHVPSAIINAAKKIWDLKEEIRNIKKEVEDRRPWGSFSFEDIKKIEDAGYNMQWHIVSQKRYDEKWAEICPLQIISDSGSRVYFITIEPREVENTVNANNANKAKDANKNVNAKDAEIKSLRAALDATICEKPKGTYLDSENKLKELENELVKTKAELMFLKEDLSELEKYYARITSDMDLYLADKSSKKAVEDKIIIYQGFAPADDAENLETVLDAEDGIYYTRRDAKAEDNPPIKLKNNAFSSIFETIGNFYMLPKYDELDLTPFFAPFYMLFFGMCLGDFGYGLVLFILGVAGLFLFPKKKNIANLVLLLGLGAMIMASMSGTIFGGNMADWFKVNPDNRLLSFLGTDKESGLPKSWPFSNLDLFWFSMIFGIVQIIFGRMISAIWAMKKCGWKAGLANIGWTSLIIWITLFFIEWYHGWKAGTVMSPALSYTLLGIAGVGILLFTATTGNIIIRILKGLTSLYDVTGLLGDVLSYIRLFALGVSGGILGMVFNSMALQLGEIPYIGWFLCILLLIVGHALVLFLSGLSAFVHPMRLTFVEFYKNAGFEGGGRLYKPLKK